MKTVYPPTNTVSGGYNKYVVRRAPLNLQFAYAKAKAQISCPVTAQLISMFVFATYIVQSLYFINPKFQASSNLLWLYSLVCADNLGNPKNRLLSHDTASDDFSNFRGFENFEILHYPLTCISSARKSRYASVSGYLPWVLSISHLYKFS